MTTPVVGAILLAGGRASRLGGATKPLLEVGGRTLLGRALEAAHTAGARPVTIVGPAELVSRDTAEPRDQESPAPEATVLREDPPFGGPVAAIVAALASWETATAPAPPWTLVLACDLPGVGAATARLMRDILLLPSDTDGLCLADASSRPQWLAGVYRTESLQRAARTIPDRGQAASVRALLDDLAIAVVAAPADETSDIDTWEDLNEARRLWPAREGDES